MSLALARPLFLALQEDFDAFTDPRVNRTRLHRLSDILLLSLAAFCRGADSFEDIQVWSLAYGKEGLQKILGVRLNNGIPHHDTFRRVLCRLAPSYLEQSLHTLRKRSSESAQGDACVAPAPRHIAVDGKEIRGSHDKTTPALALLSVFATDLNLVIGQRKIDGKTNEIPVAQEILKNVAIEGAVVTADALHCQTQTVQVIRSRNADYLLAVKDNQKNLHDALQTLFTLNKKEKRIPMTSFLQVEKGHGRLERRQGFLIRVADWLPAQDSLRAWQDWTSVLCIESSRQWTHRGQGKQSSFVRYFISSHGGTVQELMFFARSHWKIENNLHWIMDVTFGEDTSRIRKGNEAQNVATLRRVASFLLAATEPVEADGQELPKALQNLSLRKRRKLAGWKADYLRQVITN